MKRNLKKLFMAVAVSAVSVFAVLGASCDSSASEWIEDKIEQIKCEHVTTRVIERVLPTCTEKGYTEGLECVDCGKVVTKPDEVKALGHTIVTYEEVEATCLTKGTTEGEYCTVCETWLKEIKDIKPTGHSVEVIEGKDPTCTETGLTNGQACDKCGEVYVAQKEIPALGHDVNENGKCNLCGEISFETLNLDNLYNKAKNMSMSEEYYCTNGAVVFFSFDSSGNLNLGAISAHKNGEAMSFIPIITDVFLNNKNAYLSAFDENGEDLMPGTVVSFCDESLITEFNDYYVLLIPQNGQIEFEDKDGNIYAFNIVNVSLNGDSAKIYKF